MTGVCTENLGVEVIDANHTCPWRSRCPGNIRFRPLRSPGGVNNYKLRRPLGCVIRKVWP